MEVEDTNDQETKELEERLKKEYKNANKTREGYIDESEDEEDKPGMSKQAKRMQKMLQTREGNNVYDSEEEEENPYASSQEEEEEEEPISQTGPAVQSQSQSKPETPPSSQPGLETPKTSPERPQVNGTGAPATGSRASSPVPGLGGHSMVAKRATSPKVPKLKSTNASRSGSPLATSRAGSPVSPIAAPGSRAVSPNASTTVNGAQNGHQQTKKRKAEDAGSPSPTSPTGNGLPKPKKRKAQVTASAPVAMPTGPLEGRLLVEWLKNTPTANASTRECIQYFTPYLTDEEKKAQFTVLVKEIAQLKNGVLVLRPAYRDGSATPAASG